MGSLEQPVAIEQGKDMNEHAVRRGQSRANDARIAVAEFHAAVNQPNIALVVFFSSSAYDLDILATEMTRLFAGVQVVGCTTAGEIGPEGYCEHSLTGASFPADRFTAASGHLDHLQQFEAGNGQRLAQSVLQRLEVQAPGATAENSFALLLIDGLSMREEPVALALQQALGRLAMFGGSAGDDLNFRATYSYFDGAFHLDSALLILISTTLPFKIFKSQHFVASDKILVITEADPAKRIVREINGLPAVCEYARLTGGGPGDLGPNHFANFPVTVRVGGYDHVRSIQKADADGSLTFYCAIEEGVVLRVARSADLVDNLKKTFDEVRAQIGNPQVTLGCDCVLRNLEMTKRGVKDRVAEVLQRNNVVGFSSYGEQIRGVHVNQTLTGVAIGYPRKASSNG
jgi:hypothetical protein